MIPFPFSQFARLLTMPQGEWETEINRIFDRNEAKKKERVANWYADARRVVSQIVAGTLTKADARARCHEWKKEAAELREQAAKLPDLKSKKKLTNEEKEQKKHRKELVRRADVLTDNADMVEHFAGYFSLEGVVKVKGMLFTYGVHSVELQVRPSLCYTLFGRLQLVHLAFTKKAKGSQYRSLLRKLLFQSIAGKANVNHEDVYVLNVLTSERIKGKYVDTALREEMNTLARVIETVHENRAAARAAKDDAARAKNVRRTPRTKH